MSGRPAGGLIRGSQDHYAVNPGDRRCLLGTHGGDIDTSEVVNFFIFRFCAKRLNIPENVAFNLARFEINECQNVYILNWNRISVSEWSLFED